jgi:hypothetical protein
MGQSLLGADLNRAREFATQMLDLGELRGDVLTRVVGCRTSGGTSFYSGGFPAARESLERGLELYEARDLLAPVYNWFTEGFDTPVLQEAKALLDELA